MKQLVKDTVRMLSKDDRFRLTPIGKVAHVLVSAVYNHKKTRWRGHPVEHRTVFYESFDGNGMLCNPEAIFRELLARPEYRDYLHVWAISDKNAYRASIAEFENYPQVQFVTYKSDEYYRHLCTARYLINNSSFPQEFNKRPEQIYVNTWHGIPLKKMGYDIPGGGPDTRNVNRNFVAADYLLSAGPFMTNVMYRDAFKLRGVYRGRIIEEGYPRIDAINGNVSRSQVINRLQQSGVNVDRRGIVLYAPTWKGEAYRPVDDIRELKDLVLRLREKTNTREVQVLLKVHQLVYRNAELDDELRRILIPNEISTNEILSVSDVLVTDYSSLLFDFLATERPIAFYAPDREHYAESRGLYIGMDDWPGPTSTSVDELAEQVEDLLSARRRGVADAYTAQRSRWRNHYLPRQDGGSTRRVVDIVFSDRTEGTQVLRELDDGREKVLIHIGSLISNGITSAALSLLNQIDHTKYDITVVYQYSHDEDRNQKASLINDNVRMFPRVGGTALTLRELFYYRRFISAGARSSSHKDVIINALFEREWRRCMGSLKFDRIIAFDGYSPFWAMLLLQGEAKRHVIWAHNDLLLDAQRTVNGKTPHKKNLHALFSLYSRFEKIVSVSEDLKKINESKLASYAPFSTFTQARNIIDAAYIKSRALDLDGIHSLERSTVNGSAGQTPSYYGSGQRTPVNARAVIHRVTGFPSNSKILVTAGRLSPEKNQERMLRALAIARRTDSELRLIVLGGGPLLSRLMAQASDLGIEKSVFFAGQQSNPYVIMNACDCFVFSSLYEGQGLVIIEAMVLGLPIVTTEYNVVHSVISSSQGLIVEPSDSALAEGMIAFAEGRVPVPDFDPARYNEIALSEFNSAIS